MPDVATQDFALKLIKQWLNKYPELADMIFLDTNDRVRQLLSLGRNNSLSS